MISFDRDENELYDLCLGGESPAQRLLDTGELPEGWVERYLAVLDHATASWRGRTQLSRLVVAAVHFATMYLPLRYQGWINLSKIPANSATEMALARIRTRSEQFLLRDAVA